MKSEPYKVQLAFRGLSDEDEDTNEVGLDDDKLDDDEDEEDGLGDDSNEEDELGGGDE
jgi:hypothetical protein